jgi:hypothetical protein
MNAMGSDAAKRLVPVKPSGVDLSRFRLDPASRSLLELVDGVRDADEIAAALSEGPAAVRSRLEMLARSGLVAFVETEAPRREASVAAAPPAAKPADDGARIAAAWTGAREVPLASKPVKALLDELAQAAFAGGVRFERAQEAVTLYFEAGHAIGVRSELARHELGVMLRAAGKIDDRTHEAYREALAQGAGHPVVALRQAGVSDRAELARLLSWHGAAILSELARGDGGIARIAAGVPVPAGVAKVRIDLEARAASGEWRDGPLTAQEEAFIEGNASRYLVINAGAGRALAAMGLGEKEARFVRHLAASPRQVREALAISTLYRSPTRKLLCALVEGGVFALHDTSPEGAAEVPIEELAAYAERLARDNHFNVLAAHPSSTAREIEERYKVRRAQFDDARFPHAEAQHRASLTAIRARFDKAIAVLKDAESRREYRKSVFDAEQLDNFFALQLNKAEVVLKMRCDAAAALEIAESALELKPGEPEATIIAATALVRLNRRADAKRLLAAVKIVPARLKAEMDGLRQSLGA